MAEQDRQRGKEPSSDGGPSRRGKTARRILIAAGVLALAGVGVLIYWLFFVRGKVSTDDARIDGYLVDLAPEIGGTIREVLYREGQFVARGAVVFRLDARVQTAALAEARHAETGARCDLANLEAQYLRAVNGPRPQEIAAARAAVAVQEAQEKLDEIELQRSERLYKANVATEDALDRARAALNATRASRRQAEERLQLLLAGTRPEEIAAARTAAEAARGRLEQAGSAVRSAEVDLARTSVAAPFDAWVVRRWLNEGSMASPGQPVVTVFDPGSLRVRANIEEGDLHSVAVGDEVDVSVDAYPSLSLKGRVREILRATQSEFSLIPAEGVSGTFIKVAQRVPLIISVEPPEGLYLGPGLSVEVTIHVGSAKRAGR